jgi:superfamily II DNA/RNA helicase
VSFFQRENPLVRHIVLRKRQTLEDKNLLPKIAVDIHPNRDLAKKIHEFDRIFTDKAIIIDEDFRAAYKEAINYTKALKQQGKGAGFMKNLVQQRICSSIAAGISTAKKLLAKKTITEETDDEDFVLVLENPEERSVMERMLQRLEKIKNKDPKLTAVLHYLEQENWLEHGVIIFSGYYDTALWLAEELAARYATKAIGLYAGANRSKLFDNGEAVSIAREQLKQMVSEHKLEIMVATDAACEGLNLQTLGTLINIDLPWNPTKLEQRIGRIKRIGQSRSKVDMLNLVNAETVDEKVYEVISQRMQNRFDLFGGLPDTIEADWIENIEDLDEKMDEYINAQKQANAFELRYNNTIIPTDMDWRDCCNVLSRQDFNQLMRKAWDSKNS